MSLSLELATEMSNFIQLGIFFTQFGILRRSADRGWISPTHAGCVISLNLEFLLSADDCRSCWSRPFAMAKAAFDPLRSFARTILCKLQRFIQAGLDTDYCWNLLGALIERSSGFCR